MTDYDRLGQNMTDQDRLGHIMTDYERFLTDYDRL